MGKTEIESFIEVITNYFKKTAGDRVYVETPFLAESAHIDERLYDYTKRIEISGSYTGNIMFSATTAFLQEVVKQYDHVGFSEAILQDAAGEVANVLSGNARRTLGNDFVISVPYSYEQGANTQRYLEGFYSFLIPIVWKNNYACLILGVDHDKNQAA